MRSIHFQKQSNSLLIQKVKHGDCEQRGKAERSNSETAEHSEQREKAKCSNPETAEPKLESHSETASATQNNEQICCCINKAKCRDRCKTCASGCKTF